MISLTVDGSTVSCTVEYDVHVKAISQHSFRNSGREHILCKIKQSTIFALTLYKAFYALLSIPVHINIVNDEEDII